MDLGRATATFVAWVLRVAGVFFRLHPLTTTVVVACATLSRISAILAFVLPLKVILMVASDGASRWFAPILRLGVSENELIIGLTVTAVVAFFASIALDAFTERLAQRTSHSVLRGSNELAVVGDQEGRAKSIYAQVGDLLAGALFVSAGLAVVGLVQPRLGGLLLAAFLGEFLVTSLILRRTDSARPRLLGRLILNDLGDYLQILSSINFLMAFGFLLYIFVWGQGGSVLGALVCIIVLRRVLGATVQLVRSAVTLAGRRPTIDPLVFRERKYEKSEHRQARTLREVFSKAARQHRTQEALRSAGLDLEAVDVCWQDSRLQGVSLLGIYGERGDGAEVRYQQQIFPPKQDYRLRNEDVLFGHVARGRLHAPTLLLRFSEGPFECQICDMGTGELVEARVRRETEWWLRKEVACIEPPKSLIEAFLVSRPLLSQRLSDELIKRLDVGVDTDEEEQTLEGLRNVLPRLREMFEEMPYYIENPELRGPNIRQGWDGQPLVMSSGQWSLEPLGATLPPNANASEVDELVAQVKQRRSDIPEWLSSDHVWLVNRAAFLEFQIKKHLLKHGMEEVRKIVDNPVCPAVEPREAPPAAVYQGAG